MHTDNMREMNNTFRQELSTEIKKDDDVQFHWIMLSSSMEEEVSHNVLDSIIYLYITVRGFSFASSVLERYKREAKKGTQKAKHLGNPLSRLYNIIVVLWVSKVGIVS